MNELGSPHKKPIRSTVEHRVDQVIHTASDFVGPYIPLSVNPVTFAFDEPEKSRLERVTAKMRELQEQVMNFL